MIQPTILMFGWEFPPFYSGGLGIACHGLTRALTAEGASVIFVLPSHMDVSADHMRIVLAKDMPQHRVRFRPFASLLTPYITEAGYADERIATGETLFYGNTLQDEVMRYASYARSIALREEFDIIHAHDWLTYLAGIEAKRASGKPLVIHVHSTEFDRTGGQGANPFVFDIEREGMLTADAIIAISDYTKNVIVREYGIDPDKITVVHNGVEPGIHSGREEFSIVSTLRQLKANGAPIVLSLGRLTIQKGLDYFIVMAKRVLEHVPNAIFIIAGSGDMERRLMTQAAELGIADHVLFIGFLRGRQIEEAYGMADLFVVPSVSEPFGLTVLESMAHGTPVIVSKQSGVSEIIANALKVDFWDTDAMADKAIAVLKYRVLREQLSDYSRKEIRNFSWRSAAQKCLVLFKSVTGK